MKHSSSISLTSLTCQSVFSKCLLESRVFELVPAAVLDIIVEYTQYVIVQGELLCSFEIDPNEKFVPYQFVGDGNLTRGDPERGIITQKFSDIDTLCTFYSLTGEKMRQITTPLQSERNQSKFCANDS